MKRESAFEISRYRTGLLLFALCTFIGLLSFSTFYTEDLVEKSGTPPIYYLINEFTAAYGVLLLLPGILWFMDRFRFTQANWLLLVPLHLAASIVYGTLHTLIMTGSRIWLYPLFDLRPYSMGDPLYRFLMEYQKQFLMYVAILGGFYLINSFRDRREREKREAKLELQAAQLESRLRESQLQALKGQLQPHFLFNTLNMISSLMYEDVAAADEMIAKLSHLLRMSLEHADQELVPLSQELEFAEAYLGIMKNRFRDRLAFRIEVDDLLLDAAVPAFFLQPLVENAIKHGALGETDPLQVKLAARKDGGRLRIEVKDNGPGTITDQVELTEGVGLSNTRQRLENLYGDTYQFEAGNLPTGGFGVKLLIPLQDEVGAELKSPVEVS